MTEDELVQIEQRVKAHEAEGYPPDGICDWGTGEVGHSLIGDVPALVAEVRRLRGLVASVVWVDLVCPWCAQEAEAGHHEACPAAEWAP